MKLDRIELVNFCQHKHLAWDIPKGMVGILGPNGSGKSNLIRGIVYALTGVGLPRDQLLRQGASKGSVTLEFHTDVDLLHYRIVRELHTSRAELWQLQSDGWTLVVAGVTPLRDYLREHMSLDVDVIRTVLAVPQESLALFFHETPSKRMELLVHLFGLDFLRSRRALAKACYEQCDKTLDQALFMLDQRRTQLGQYTITKEYLEEHMPADPDCSVEAIQQRMKSLDERIYACIWTVTTTRQAEAQEKLCDQLRQQLEALLPPLPPAGLEQEPELAEKMHRLATSLRECQDFNALLATICKLDETRPPSVTPEEIRQAEDAVAELRVREAAVNYQISAEGLDRCPVCGSEMHQQLPLDEWHAERETVLARLREAEELRQTLAARHERYTSWFRRISEKLEQARQQDPAWRLVVGETFFPDELARAQQTVKELAKEHYDLVEQLRTFEEYHTAVAKYDRDSELIRLRSAEAQQKLEQIRQELERFGSPDDQKELEGQKQELQNMLVQHGALVEQRRTYQETLDRIAALEAEIETLCQQLDMTKKRDLLKEIDQLLIPGNLPQQIVNRLLEHILRIMNRYLAACGTPYSVILSAEGDLLCQKESATQLVAHCSGGEKMMLAIAFRLAVHEAFAKDDTGGFMVLDEPTTFLDDTNRDCLRAALTSLSNSCADKQILVITHDMSLETLFQECLRLRV